MGKGDGYSQGLQELLGLLQLEVVFCNSGNFFPGTGAVCHN